MGDKSKIEWTDATWNPIAGCSTLSPGCTNCYAMKMARRLEAIDAAATSDKSVADLRKRAVGHYRGTTKIVNGNAVWTGVVNPSPDHILLAPLKWKRPRMIFVNSMSDLFHENVPDEWIDRVFAVMALASQHTFQVLTKRAERMREFMARLEAGHNEILRVMNAAKDPAQSAIDVFPHYAGSLAHPSQHGLWPLSNVWLGVSAEDQKRYDERKEHLRATPAAVHFFSFEPLLGPIVGDYFGEWSIVGGESGQAARPMHPDWARGLRDQCQTAGVPFFYKQTGEWVTGYLDREDFHVDEETHGPDVHWNGTARCIDIPGDSGHFGRVGKRAAGRLLDGREHNEMPERAS